MPKYIFEENPNPRAKIAFMIWSPFHYYVYKNIAKYIPEAEFIVCDTWYKTMKEYGREHIKNSVSLLKSNNCFWRVFTDIFNFGAAESFFSQYGIIASVLHRPPLTTLDFGNNDWFSEKKSVLISYGAGKDLNTFGPWVAHFDMSLVDGPRTHRYHKLFTNSHIIGVPKFDDWFQNMLDQKEIEHIRARLDPKKKTILYLPTHSGLSSLYKFGDTIRSLGRRYNLLVKLHSHNKLTESKIAEKFYQDKTIFLFGEENDILPLFFLADAVLSDSSSATLEALLADKPLVILETVTDRQMLENHTKGEEFNQYWYSGALTYPGSIEQKIKNKKWGLCELIRAADKNLIQAAIERSIRRRASSPERKKILNNIFAYRDGASGKRAAKIIRDFGRHKKPELPLLGMAAHYYLKNLERNYAHQHQKTSNSLQEKNIAIYALERELESYRSIKEEKSFFKKALFAIKHLI